MALYQDTKNVTQKALPLFTTIYDPGTPAPYAGIYICAECSHEIGIAQGHRLPPETHPRHPVGKDIRWQVLVVAQHNVAP